LSLWAAVRQWSGFSFAGYGSDVALAGWLAGAALVLAVQAGAAGYAFARWRLVSAPPALFAAATTTWYLFLHVGGETDVLWVWTLGYGPLLTAGVALAIAVEYGVRRTVAAAWAAAD
ncbi:hypothetical protein GRX66_18300, partial [Halobacterium sp. PCN9]